MVRLPGSVVVTSFGKVSISTRSCTSLRTEKNVNKITRDQKRKLHDMDDAELDKLGLSKEEFQALIESKDWAKVVEGHRAFIQSIKALVAKGQAKFAVQVNYDRSIEDARKDGNYDWENSDITSKNFPTTRKGTVHVVVRLIHFGCEISSEDAIAEMDKLGLRPAETHELLDLSAAHPDLQRKFPIIALGSVWQDHDGYRSVPSLGRPGFWRRLYLSRFDGRWNARCRFAAVPK